MDQEYCGFARLMSSSNDLPEPNGPSTNSWQSVFQSNKSLADSTRQLSGMALIKSKAQQFGRIREALPPPPASHQR